LVVCIVGVALAAFLPTFLRELRLSKVSEAAEYLALMHARAAAYFAAEHETEGGPMRHCLPPGAGPTPAEPSEEPVAVNWRDERLPGGETWRALGFAPERPVRFTYMFEPTSVGCGLRSPPGTYLVTFRAQGDLDGDGERSIFERRAAVDPETGELVPLGILYVRDRTE
jgi:type II secretory pathway pseudopilin PulG